MNDEDVLEFWRFCSNHIETGLSECSHAISPLGVETEKAYLLPAVV